MLRNLQIKVTVWDMEGRPLQLVYTNPLTGKRIRKSAGTRNRREAERKAARWEEELRTTAAIERTGWDKFRQRFEDEHLTYLKKSTQENYCMAMNRFERDIGHPSDLSVITSSVLSQWRSDLTEAGLRPATVASYVRFLRSSLGWASKMGMVATVPRVVMPQANTSRGRPVNYLEFAHFLRALRDGQTCEDSAKQLVDLAIGLWLSGLRLAEALRLSWDQPPVQLVIDNLRPRIRYSDQKNGKVETIPITPDFAKFLDRFTARSGPVFSVDMATRTISKRFSEAGRAADIRVSERKHLTAHDLRRTFAQRWAPRVHPLVLKKLMRHSSMETTLRYYLDTDASAMAEQLWNQIDCVQNSVQTAPSSRSD